MSEDLRLILGLLLDRYERSKHYASPGESARAVFLRYDRESLPDYWDESRWQRRGELNQATAALAGRGLIAVHYARHSREEIARVDLVLDRVDEAYRLANRTPRRVQEEALAATASAWATRWPDDWRRHFAGAIITAVDSFRRLPAGFKPGESPLLDEVCRVLDHLGSTGLDAEIPRRLFSQRVLGSSKRLEAIQARLLRVLRDFWPVPLPQTDAEALAELGILENPQHLLIAGPVTFDGLSVASVEDAIGLPPSFIERCRVTALEADHVITVENLTSFHELVGRLPPRTVAVYLGGYHNRPRRRLLEKLAGARPLAFWHWGDIDLGGFRIFVHLRAKTNLPIQPLLMDPETYLSHQHQGMDCTPAYLAEVAALLDKPEYGPFHATIREVLQHRRRVEQESVPFQAPSELA